MSVFEEIALDYRERIERYYISGFSYYQIPKHIWAQYVLWWHWYKIKKTP